MFEVQYGVPLPKPTRHQPRRKYPLTEMDVGGMFFIPDQNDRTVQSVRTWASRVGNKTGKTFTVRKCTMMFTEDMEWKPCDENAEGAQAGVGVWRTA